jgi:hypothetical protein
LNKEKPYLFSTIRYDVVALYHHAFRVNQAALRLSYPASPGLSSPLRALLLVPRATGPEHPPIPGSIREIRRYPRYECGPAHRPVRSLLPQDLVIPLEMQIQVPLQSLIPDEPLPADAALEFHRFVHFGYRVDVEPIIYGLVKDLNAC